MGDTVTHDTALRSSADGTGLLLIPCNHLLLQANRSSQIFHRRPEKNMWHFYLYYAAVSVSSGLVIYCGQVQCSSELLREHVPSTNILV